VLDADARERVGRIEALLDRVDALPDPAARDTATEAVEALVELYGEGLARLVGHVAERDDGRLAAALAEDELVSHLLLLHGLHPVPLEARVRGALDEVRPYLASHGGGVELLGVEEGVVRLRMEGSCDGCPSSAATLALAIEDAVHKAAPDVVGIEADGAVAPATPPGLIQLEIHAPLPAAPAPAWAVAGGMPDLVDGRPLVRAWTGACTRTGRAARRAPRRSATRRSPAVSSPARAAATPTTSCWPAAVATCLSCTWSPCRCSRTTPGSCAWRWDRRPEAMAAGADPLATSRLGRLAARATREREAVQERCELCGAPVEEQHRHLLDLSRRELMCCCRACAILFAHRAAGGAGGHYRLVPDRRLQVDDLQLDDVAWAELRLPVDIAFFVRDGVGGRVQAFYPSPMGPTESLLGLGAWDELVAANPVLAGLRDDVEALLVDRARGARRQWLVPIDECYALVGVIRTNWRGLTGGREVWEEIGRFFEGLDRRSRAAGRDGATPSAAAAGPAERG
jgi:Fe-S cluster biogenesis protein NfuA